MFEPFEYLDALVDLRRTWVGADPFHDPEHRNTAVVASASLSRLLPEIPRSRHPELIGDVLFHQRWAGLDEGHLFRGEDTSTLDFLLGTTEVVDPQGVLPRAAGGQPFLFCTFHHGSYRLINVLLGASGVSFSLVVDRNTVNGQGEKFLRMCETFRARTGSGIRMDILDAEASHTGLHAMRRLRAGGALLFYIDGNTGVGGVQRRDDKLVPVSLLSHTIYARKGIAFLSHTAGVPVVPVICERTGWLTRRITFHPAIAPRADTERESYCRDTTQAVYSLLEPVLQRSPEQWEGWLYVHRFLDLEALHAPAPPPAAAADPAGDDLLVVDEERYAVMRMRDTPVLFDRATYRAVPLSPPLQDVVSVFSRPTAAGTVFPSGAGDAAALVRELVHRGVLVRHVGVPEPGTETAPLRRSA